MSFLAFLSVYVATICFVGIWVPLSKKVPMSDALFECGVRTSFMVACVCSCGFLFHGVMYIMR
jgi:hypothetical protein